MEIKIVIDINDVAEFNSLYFNEHPKAKNKPIKAPEHPSLNWYMRANNFVVDTVKANWKDFIVFILQKYNLLNQKIDYCDVIYTTYFSRNKRIDVDNITPKFIMDGLVAGEFLVDDSISHLTLLTRGFIDNDNPRIELQFCNIKKKGE